MKILLQNKIDEYYKIGKTIENKHFTSSSYDAFAIGEAMRERPYSILIRIEGKSGRLIEDLSTLKSEKEVLFKSNSKFYVKEIKTTSNPADWSSSIKTIILIEK
ncbi:ADP-ribosyltransferase [Chryseobacterium sp. FH2]|uniref:ADP-ribosyltransferase n=1 Tax=Chryseobacterium sp. FH2 TaxID=1674291 RepID=UPI00069EACBD|nr:ADP-ribosyltransferase [Chryseobacterium sp. FH2]